MFSYLHLTRSERRKAKGKQLICLELVQQMRYELQLKLGKNRRKLWKNSVSIIFFYYFFFLCFKWKTIFVFFVYSIKTIPYNRNYIGVIAWSIIFSIAWGWFHITVLIFVFFVYSIRKLICLWQKLHKL